MNIGGQSGWKCRGFPLLTRSVKAAEESSLKVWWPQAGAACRVTLSGRSLQGRVSLLSSSAHLSMRLAAASEKGVGDGTRTTPSAVTRNVQLSPARGLVSPLFAVCRPQPVALSVSVGGWWGTSAFPAPDTFCWKLDHLLLWNKQIDLQNDTDSVILKSVFHLGAPLLAHSLSAFKEMYYWKNIYRYTVYVSFQNSIPLLLDNIMVTKAAAIYDLSSLCCRALKDLMCKKKLKNGKNNM